MVVNNNIDSKILGILRTAINRSNRMTMEETIKMINIKRNTPNKVQDEVEDILNRVDTNQNLLKRIRIGRLLIQIMAHKEMEIGCL